MGGPDEGSWLGPWRVLFGGLVVPLLPLKRGRHLGELGPVRLIPVAVLGGLGCTVWVPFGSLVGSFGGLPGAPASFFGWLFVSQGLTDID